ncbi:MAG: hypothetical protein AAF616_12310 [Bacteroidota bacterium]
MRNSISLSLLCIVLFSCAKKLAFEDPDLTFTLRSPPKWILVDDGFVAKIAPSFEDTASTYVTVTYFEHPTAAGNYLKADSQVKGINLAKERGGDKDSLIILDTEVAGSKSSKTLQNKALEITRYDFYVDGKDWQIQTSVPQHNAASLNRQFEKIITSFKVKNTTK